MKTNGKLVMTEVDARRLRMLLENASGFNEHDRSQWQALEEEIEKATIVPASEVPANVVTMHSRVRIVDLRTGEQLVYRLVYPHEANYMEKKISVLAPIGMALLGCSEGTEIDWQVPSGKRRLRVEAVEQQTRAALTRAAA